MPINIVAENVNNYVKAEENVRHKYLKTLTWIHSFWYVYRCFFTSKEAAAWYANQFLPWNCSIH